MSFSLKPIFSIYRNSAWLGGTDKLIPKVLDKSRFFHNYIANYENQSHMDIKKKLNIST